LNTNIRKQYFDHILKYCCDIQADKRFVMLSGGVDSFMLLAALMQRFNPQDVTALLIRGVKTPDFAKAEAAAKYFGVKTYTKTIRIDDYLDNTYLCRNTNDTSVFQLIFRVAADLLLRDITIKDSAVYQGDGADSLYGTHSPFIYIESTELSRKMSISKNEAREILRCRHRRKRLSGKCSGTAPVVADVIQSFSGIPVQPWVSGEFEYVLDVPLSEFKGPKKKWVVDGLVSEWGIDRRIAKSRARITMQEGIGFYKVLCKELCRKYKTKTANTAVKMITKGAL